MKVTIHGCRWKDEKMKVAYVGDVERNLPKKDRLKWMQKMVEGLIDVYHHEGRDLIFNNEGLILGMPLNPWALEKGMRIAGTIIEVHGILSDSEDDDS